MEIPKNNFKAAIQHHIADWLVVRFGRRGRCARKSAPARGSTGSCWTGSIRPTSFARCWPNCKPWRRIPRRRSSGRHGDVAIIKQLLDIGVQTLLIPWWKPRSRPVCWPGHALSLAGRRGTGRATGFRGIGGATSRAARWGRVENYLHQADAQVCLLVQVETRLVSKIWSDCGGRRRGRHFRGTVDLTASLGMLGQAMAPEGQPAMKAPSRGPLHWQAGGHSGD